MAARTEVGPDGAERLLELGMQRFDADAAGRILATGGLLAWWDEAGAPPPVGLALAMRHSFPGCPVRGVTDLEAALAIGDLAVARNPLRISTLMRERLPAVEGWNRLHPNVAPRWLGIAAARDAPQLAAPGPRIGRDCPLVEAAGLMMLLDAQIDGETPRLAGLSP